VADQWCDRVLAAFLVVIVEKVEVVFMVIPIQGRYQKKKKVVVVFAAIAIPCQYLENEMILMAAEMLLGARVATLLL
jgi:hypothetical protein